MTKYAAAVLLLAVSLVVSGQPATRKAAGTTLRIVKDDLLFSGNGISDYPSLASSLAVKGNVYYVKGTIYNPSNDGVKNVVINYHIWKKYMGDGWKKFVGDGAAPVYLPLTWKETGGLVSALIKYLPPKQMVEFTATGQDAYIATVANRMSLPDPINAEISAEWDEP